jgi:hypothetical protein
MIPFTENPQHKAAHPVPRNAYRIPMHNFPPEPLSLPPMPYGYEGADY